MSEPSTFSPQDFRSNLQSGERRRDVPPVLSLSGLITYEEAHPGTLRFSMNSCASWVTLPETLIKEIEFVRDVPCGDHEHPYVELRFVDSDNPDVQAALGLLVHVQQASAARAKRLQSALAAVPPNAFATGPTDLPSAPQTFRRHWPWWYLTATPGDYCIDCLSDCDELHGLENRRVCRQKCC